jgi:DNA-binding response OmpR family regulator
MIPRVLIVEDEVDIAESIRRNLAREGRFVAATVGNAEDALKELSARAYDLLVLDLNLPGIDGLELCRQLRRNERTARIPILMLTARVEEADVVVGLEFGADDYMVKPFRMRELQARLQALLRRSQLQATAGGEVYRDGELEIFIGEYRALVAGKPLRLTKTEFDLLATLVVNRGRVLSRERLLEKVWGYHSPSQTRTVDVHVKNLRAKLGAKLSHRIETVFGVGYRFVEV